MTDNEKVQAAAEYIEKRISNRPESAIILGSGLGGYEDGLNEAVRIPYKEIPGFQMSTAPGHKGEMVIGERCGKIVLVMSGRFHYYEGYSMQEITFPIRVMSLLSIKRLIITNASGGINPTFSPGSLMLVKDHINLSGCNPLIGLNFEKSLSRFPDMGDAYSAKLRSIIKEKAASENIPICEGVYAFMTGPSFETPAEIRMISTIGGDAVGMSSVPEAIAARSVGIEVAAISCITNMATGISERPLSGDEVLEIGRKTAPIFARIVDAAIEI